MEPEDKKTTTDEQKDQPPKEELKDEKPTDEKATDEKPADKTALPAEPAKDAEATTITPEAAKVKKSHKKLAIIVGAIIFVLVAGGASAYFFYFKDKWAGNNEQPGDNNQTEPTVTPNVEVLDPILARLINPTTGESWLNPIVPIEKQGYFVDNDGDGYSDEDGTDYYQVGSRGDNTIIMTNTEIMGEYLRLFERLPGGQVTYIAQPNGNATYNEENLASAIVELRGDIVVDESIHYDSLTIPDQMTLDTDQNIVNKPTYPTIGSIYQAPTPDYPRVETVIRQLGQAQIVKSEYSYADTNLTSIYYFLKTALSTSITLVYQPLDTDLSLYQWQSGAVVSDTLKPINRGCSALFNSAVARSDALTEADVTVAGESGQGLTVYKITDTNNALVLKAYQEFMETGGSTAESANFADISIDDFVNQQHALVIFKDNYDQWLVYASETFSPPVGCAKPVIYLYPAKDQLVSVKVGADVKLSEPLYDVKKGWLAYAKTNGQLQVNNQRYNSLFWEGLGYGAYPAVTEGTAVKQQDALQTIRWQLAQQGLNSYEIADFVDYWQDKLPNKPYIRLTWFNTVQMNQLAPLSISPKPDTLIRVFLDAEGYNEPIDLPAQDLKPVMRLGFTVVEWGGLSSQRLY
jgi:hypothetical protein